MGAGLTAIIIGGGIGGLAAAISLRQAGIEATVCERAPELKDVGAGLSLWPNAVLALGLMGLSEAVQEVGASLEQAQVRTWDGRVLKRVPIGRWGEQFGARPLFVHRASLQGVLLNALDTGVVRLGLRCVGFRQDASGVAARFANGKDAQGDFLVGADGIHSVVRAQLHPGDRLRYAGYAAWRGVAHLEHSLFEAGNGFNAWDQGRLFGAFPVGPGRVYWFGSRNSTEGTADAPMGRKQEVLDTFRGWHEPVEVVIGATEEESILLDEVFDRRPLKWWGEGRVTLLGDAAHPATPNLGQGACQAMEDAVVLARCVREGGSIEAVLRRYEAHRRGRTAFITRLSRWYGRLERAESPLVCGVRNTLVRITPPGVMRRQLALIMRPDL